MLNGGITCVAHKRHSNFYSEYGHLLLSSDTNDVKTFLAMQFKMVVVVTGTCKSVTKRLYFMNYHM